VPLQHPSAPRSVLPANSPTAAGGSEVHHVHHEYFLCDPGGAR
jgi:hypothetical protein